MLLQGQGGSLLRLISAYCPSSNSLGPHSVAMQHKRFFLMRDAKDVIPRDQFFIDLLGELTVWIQQGDQLIIGLDANEDVQLGQTAAFFRQLGMKEAILSKQSQSPPATQHWNT